MLPSNRSTKRPQKYTEIPVELATSPVEIVINEVNSEALSAMGAEVDAQWGKKPDQPADSSAAAEQPSKGDKDWNEKKTTDAAKTTNAKAGGKKGGKVDLTPLPEGTDGATIVKAANAWSRGGGADDDGSKVTRAVKSILNKITPEKFDRLMEQLLEVGITTAAALSDTISIVFDKAIWEPGFCGMYADVCLRLSKELPEFPGESSDGKPMTFRRILLNTCQEEFEGAGQARTELSTITDPAERAAATKRVKLRTMGNIRLIGELFKKKMIAEKILHACVTDLLGAPGSTPPDENIEALTGLMSTVGKDLDNSPKMPKEMMGGYFTRLQALADNESLDSRVRFLCNDVIELRKSEWIPRVKKLEAMTLGEIHAEAAAAGLMSPAAAEEILFPEGPGGSTNAVGGDWEMVGKDGATGDGSSALSGPYVAAKHKAAMPTEKEKAKRDAELRKLAKERAMQAVTGTSAASPSTSAPGPAPGAGTWDEEKVEEKCGSAVAEFIQVADVKEAVLSVREILEKAKNPAAALDAVLGAFVTHVVDSSNEKHRDLCAKLFIQLRKESDGMNVTESALADAVGEPVSALDDIAIDTPMAPKLLGGLVASLIIGDALAPTFIADGAKGVEDVLYRREYVAAIFKELRAKGKKDAKAYAADGGVDVKGLLAGDPEFDSPLAEFLEKNGLKELA